MKNIAKRLALLSLVAIAMLALPACWNRDCDDSCAPKCKKEKKCCPKRCEKSCKKEKKCCKKTSCPVYYEEDDMMMDDDYMMMDDDK